jgi:branched-chain amino acid transport system substrate-binding protein
MPSLTTLKKLEIDGIFFAGDWTNALVTIRQINSIYAGEDRPFILLSDGCAKEELLWYGKQDVENVYLTHQLTVEEFNEESYGIYGIKAGNEIVDIINRSHDFYRPGLIKRWLNIKRVNDAREAIGKAMEMKYKGVYRAKAKFHIWQIINDTTNHNYTFTEAKQD